MNYLKSAIIVVFIFAVVIIAGLKYRDNFGKNNTVPISALTIKSLEDKGLKEFNFTDIYGDKYTIESFKD